MTPTDVILLRELEQLTEARGASTISTRQLAELTGITQKTVVRSLSRLASTGHISRTKRAHGSNPAHWKTNRDRTETGARITSRSTQGNGTGTADIFRRRDLQGPGALYQALPDIGYLTAEQALGYTALTSRVRTVEWWLVVLGSQKWAMVDEVIPDDGGPALWAKNHLQDWQLQENADHLDGVAAACGRRGLKTRRKMELQHQLDRTGPGRMFPLSRTVAP